MTDPDHNDMPAPEDVEVRRKRLKYRAAHRGMLEMDIIMGGFVSEHASDWIHEQMDRFEKFMDEQDADLFKWIMGQEKPPADVDGELVETLYRYQQNRSRI